MRRDVLARLVKLHEDRVRRARERVALALAATREAELMRDAAARGLLDAARACGARAMSGATSGSELAAAAAEGSWRAAAHVRAAAALADAEARLSTRRAEASRTEADRAGAERKLAGVDGRHRALLAARGRAREAAEEGEREDLALGRWRRNAPCA